MYTIYHTHVPEIVFLKSKSGIELSFSETKKTDFIHADA